MFSFILFVSLAWLADIGLTNPTLKYKALSFPGDAQSFVTFEPDIGDLTNSFSFCGWFKPQSNSAGSWPILISYGGNEFRIQANGGHNCIFGAGMRISNKFPRAEKEAAPFENTWFHYCATWKATSREFKEYLEGDLVVVRATASERRLQPGLSLTLGNWGDGGLEGLQFHGEMFNVNIFSRELTNQEVADRSRDMCGFAEEQEGGLLWEYILEQPRNGNVVESDPGCLEVNKLQERLVVVKNKLKVTRTRAHQVKRKLEDTIEDMFVGISETEEIGTIQEKPDILLQHISNKKEQLSNLQRIISLMEGALMVLDAGEVGERSTENEGAWEDPFLGFLHDQCKEITVEMMEKVQRKWGVLKERMLVEQTTKK